MSEKITLQNIFDLAWQAFIVEGRQPAWEHGLGCVYLTKSGGKCGVGLAIPDGHPAQKFKGGFADLRDEFTELFDESILNMRAEDLRSFQSRLHDGMVNKSEARHGNISWDRCQKLRKKEYIYLALDFDLSVPE